MYKKSIEITVTIFTNNINHHQSSGSRKMLVKAVTCYKSVLKTIKRSRLPTEDIKVRQRPKQAAKAVKNRKRHKKFKSVKALWSWIVHCQAFIALSGTIVFCCHIVCQVFSV
jgi:hypothetical protein